MKHIKTEYEKGCDEEWTLQRHFRELVVGVNRYV